MSLTVHSLWTCYWPLKQPLPLVVDPPMDRSIPLIDFLPVEERSLWEDCSCCWCRCVSGSGENIVIMSFTLLILCCTWSHKLSKASISAAAVGLWDGAAAGVEDELCLGLTVELGLWAGGGAHAAEANAGSGRNSGDQLGVVDLTPKCKWHQGWVHFVYLWKMEPGGH